MSPAWTQEGISSWCGEDFYGRPAASDVIYNNFGIICNTLHIDSLCALRERLDKLPKFGQDKGNGHRI
jgi:hypothetical protein